MTAWIVSLALTQTPALVPGRLGGQVPCDSPQAIVSCPPAPAGEPQPEFVNPLDYGEDPGRLINGQPVASRPGYVWRHRLSPAGGGGWTMVPLAAPAPSPGLVCDPRPNPYTEPERAAACYLADVQRAGRPPMPTYEVGEEYVGVYGERRMVVIAVARALEGVPVITAQMTAGPQLGQIFAFRATEMPFEVWLRAR